MKNLGKWKESYLKMMNLFKKLIGLIFFIPLILLLYYGWKIGIVQALLIIFGGAILAVVVTILTVIGISKLLDN